IDAHLLRLLPETEGVGRRGTYRRDTHLDDLLDTGLGRLRAAGDDERPELLTAVVGAPEANERTIPKGKIDDILRADAESPEAVAPHLGDPFPIFHAIEHADGDTTAGARGEVVADSVILRGRRQRA